MRKPSGDTLLALGALVLLAYTVALVLWMDQARFEAFKNFQRIALMVPVTWGAALMCLPSLLDRHDTARQQGASNEPDPRSIAVVAVAILLPFASLAWWLIAPDT